MDLSMFSLDGTVAVVTGGNGGIGLGIGRGLAKAGADIAVWGRNADKNAAAVEELEGYGVSAAAFGVDVADEEAVVGATVATLDRFGRVDTLVINAGIAGGGSFPQDFPTEEWDRVMDVNVRGAFLTAREVSKPMVATGDGGSVIVVGSIGGILGMNLSPHYSASKGAVLALTRSLAVRLARYGIRVNAIAPGFIRTEMTEEMADPKFEEIMIKARNPMRRWGEVDDFEGPAVFLASDASRFMTGTTIVVDGGFLVS
jgi:NAD(P)-dependent dehydrogenase (short-subunit alcohol dehydrogenase family)